MQLISLVAGCFNEEENVKELYERVRAVFDRLKDKYEFELLFIDNCSADGTVAILKELSRADKRIKIIVNTRNFGPLRSGYHALFQARGDAIVGLASDLQDPPEMIPEFIRKWEDGYKVVMAVKTESKESPLFFAVRKVFYSVIGLLSDIKLIKNATGFGLYDRAVIEILRKIDDPYPYFRGLICEIGYTPALIPFVQPVRKRGFSKHNFYSLYDLAMLGITSHSKVPLRLATFAGFGLSLASFLLALAYLVYKLIYWDRFSAGMAPVVIGLFFFSSVQLFFIGMLGEYIGSIHTQILKRPLVIERERVNFD